MPPAIARYPLAKFLVAPNISFVPGSSVCEAHISSGRPFTVAPKSAPVKQSQPRPGTQNSRPPGSTPTPPHRAGSRPTSFPIAMPLGPRRPKLKLPPGQTPAVPGPELSSAGPPIPRAANSSPFQFCKLTIADGPKTYLVSNRNQSHHLVVGAEHAQRCPSKEPPRPRRRHRVDRRLSSCDSHTSGRHPFPRARETRRCDCGGQVAEVSKSGSKPEEVCVIGLGTVNFNDLRRLQAMHRGNLIEVRAKLAPITHRNFYRAGFGCTMLFGTLLITANRLLDLCVVG